MINMAGCVAACMLQAGIGAAAESAYLICKLQAVLEEVWTD